MTNYEKIKNMTIEEMAGWLNKTLNEDYKSCSCCNNMKNCTPFEDCQKHRLKWLESEC